MDQTNILIRTVKPLSIPKIEIETTEGRRYVSNLAEFEPVYCFPKSQSEWENVGITAHGYNLTWGNRFEVHVTQVIDSAESVEDIKRHA